MHNPPIATLQGLRSPDAAPAASERDRLRALQWRNAKCNPEDRHISLIQRRFHALLSGDIAFPMILSFSHNFIFVRPVKVAGTSVEIVLSTICGGKDVVSPLIPIDERKRQEMGGFCGNYSDSREAEKLFNRMVRIADAPMLDKLTPPPGNFTNHMSVDAIARLSGISADDFRIISIKRNPYARLISFLHMKQHFKDYRRGDPMPGKPSDMETIMDEVIAEGKLDALRSLDLYGDTKPKFLRYENIEQDIAALAVFLGVKLPPLPHTKQGAMSNSIDPLSIFRRDQINLFNACLASEFDALGYEML